MNTKKSTKGSSTVNTKAISISTIGKITLFPSKKSAFSKEPKQPISKSTATKEETKEGISFYVYLNFPRLNQKRS